MVTPRGFAILGALAATSMLPVSVGAEEPAGAGEAGWPGSERPPEAQARDLFFAALESIRGERWAQAERDLRQSQALVSRPSTLYNLALAVYKQGRLLESIELVQALLDGAAGEPDARYHEFGERLLERARTELPELEVSVRPVDAVLSVNGRVLEERGAQRKVALDPGRSRLSLSAPGYEERVTTVLLVAGERQRLELRLDRSSTPEPSGASRSSAPATGLPPRTTGSSATRGPVATARDSASSGAGPWPWVVAGTGSAMLVGSVVTGLLAKGADDDFVSQCPSGRDCDPGLRSLQRRVETLGRLTDVLLIGGGVLLAGGVTWWLLDTPTDGGGQTRAGLRLSGGGIRAELGARF